MVQNEVDITASRSTSRHRVLSIRLPEIFLALGLFLLTVGSLSCGFDPPIDDNDDDDVIPTYPRRSTPENAIKYLKTAWELKDSLAVDSVYAGDYQGISTDQADPGGVTVLNFTESDEIKSVAGLARAIDVGTVTFTLPSESVWTRVPSQNDPPDWVAIQIFNGIKLTIVTNNGQDMLEVSGSKFTFKMRPVVSAPSDTLWEIVRWEELRE